MDVNDFMPKLCSKFYCENCDYNTSKKSSYDNHLLSRKHKKSMVINDFMPKINDFMPKLCSYICDVCNKKYKDNSGLWRHKKSGVCKKQFDTLNNVNIDNKNIEKLDDKNDLIIMLIKENAEFKSMLMEQQNMMIEQQNILMKEQQNIMMKVIENGINNTTITQTNSHNKAFNLNFFLNETCKDAMNISDFVDSIKLQLSDLERVGEVGYVQGISNIIIKNLNALDETKRPVHCTDKKRETIYIKDQGQWEKEDENKTKLKRLISRVSSKNIKLIGEFQEKYPEYRKCDHRYSDKYNKMIIEAMGGPGDNNREKEDKIIRNISKVITITQK